MFEEKESLWRRKGFYVAICTALICILAIGTVYYRMNYQDNNNGTNLFADSATEVPGSGNSTAGGAAITQNGEDNAGQSGNIDVAQNDTSSSKDENEAVNASVNQSQSKDMNTDNSTKSPANKKSSNNASKKGKNSSNSDTKKSKNTDADKANTKKSKNTDKTNADKENTKTDEDSTDKGDDSVTTMTGTGSNYKFDAEKGLLWPVSGDIILKYSMSNTIYFKTLAQYKYNPAIIIAASTGTKVKSAADGVVTQISRSDELGNIVTVDIGSGYTVTYGQLENISVEKGQQIKEGDIIAKIAEPTKYYSEEGSNLYLQVMENGKSVDPMYLLR